MGKEIESILDPKHFKLVGKYDIDNSVQENMTKLPDVAIEFTTPGSFIQNLEFLASKNVNVVCGTTGWYDKIEEVKKIVSEYDIGFIYASNFSIGVNIFFQLVRNASEIINKFKQYNVSMEETHHTQKLDKPSGTAIRIAEYLIENLDNKEKIVNNEEQPRNNELNIISKRIENIVGNHKVIMDSTSDTIILEHNAKSRRGFAEGALLAAKFIYDQKGFYKFEEIFNKLI
jgi:4-hydroxy-tetrahydrodipicolinate reductase